MDEKDNGCNESKNISAISTEELVVGYGRKVVIDDVNVEIKRGEIITLIGPNGAGKSTLLKSLVAQIKNLGGKVIVENEELKDLSIENISKLMSFVSTEKIKQDMITCREIVELGRYPYTGHFMVLSKEDKKKVKEALLMVSAEDIADKEYAKCSDGQKQKIKLAMAICKEPEIMVLDEPTSFLDIKHKIEILNILKEMSNRGVTIVMSLHELEFARLIADKVICVADGRVVKFGDCEEVFDDDFINGLYKVENGRFSTEFGTTFLKPVVQRESKDNHNKCENSNKVFVLAGNGSGISLFNKLSKQGKQIVTGVLFENDVDAHVAKAMGAEVIEAKAFEPVNDKYYDIAINSIENCEEIIIARDQFGTLEKINKKIYEYIKSLNKY